MRARSAILPVALALTLLALGLGAGVAIAAPRLLAQDVSDDANEADVGKEDVSGGDAGEGEGQSDADAETGAGEGETGEAATEEGPPWTYQMARIAIALLVLVAGALGLLYYRLIVQRSRGAA